MDDSDPSSAALRPNAQAFRLSDLLYQITRSTSSQAHAKGIQLHLSLAGDLPDCYWGDALGLRQSLLALVSLVISASDAAEVTVRVSRRGFEAGLMLLEFSVSGVPLGVSQHDAMNAWAESRGASESRIDAQAWSAFEQSVARTGGVVTAPRPGTLPDSFVVTLRVWDDCRV